MLFNKDGRLRGNGGVDRVAVMPLLNGKGKEEARAHVQCGKLGLRLLCRDTKQDRGYYSHRDPYTYSSPPPRIVLIRRKRDQLQILLRPILSSLTIVTRYLYGFRSYNSTIRAVPASLPKK